MGKQRLLSYFFSQYCGVILIHLVAISWDVNDSSVKLKQQQILSFGDKKHMNVYILFLLPHCLIFKREG
jgi:hypothetical protein